jgi:hypothetical protein
LPGAREHGLPGERKAVPGRPAEHPGGVIRHSRRVPAAQLRRDPGYVAVLDEVRVVLVDGGDEDSAQPQHPGRLVQYRVGVRQEVQQPDHHDRVHAVRRERQSRGITAHHASWHPLDGRAQHAG